MKLTVSVLLLCSCSLSGPGPGHHVQALPALQYRRFSEENKTHSLTSHLLLRVSFTFFTVLGTKVVLSIGICLQETQESDFKLVLQ